MQEIDTHVLSPHTSISVPRLHRMVLRKVETWVRSVDWRHVERCVYWYWSVNYIGSSGSRKIPGYIDDREALYLIQWLSDNDDLGQK